MISRTSTFAALALALLAPAGATARPAGPGVAQPASATSAIDAAMASVARIACGAGTSGSGFVYDMAGHIVTNAHVLGGRDRCTVSFPDGRSMAGVVIGRDPRIDLAVIRVEAFAGLQPLRLARARPALGTPVFALGSPLDFPFSATSGIVSGAGRAYDAAWPVDFLQHDAALNPGNSGGPLIDASGAVLGVNTATPQETMFDIGIGLAIPAEVVRTIADTLIRDRQVVRGALGLMVSVADAGIARAMGAGDQPGLLVDAVAKDGPADAAGLKPGDIVTSVAGRAVLRPRELSMALLTSRPGQVVQLTVLRGGQALMLSATLTRDDPDAGGRGHAAQAAKPYPPTPGLGLSFAAAEDGRARITAVAPGSAAEQFGLRQGDLVLALNGVAARDAASLPEQLAAITTDLVVLRVQRVGIGMRHVALPRTPEGATMRAGITSDDRSVGPV